MKKMLLLLATAVLAGCASSGTNFKEQNISQLQPGVTTVQEAQALFGAPPVQTVAVADGRSVVWWRYISSNGFTSKLSVKEAGLVFGTDGRLQRIAQLQNVPISDTDRQRLFAPTAAR